MKRSEAIETKTTEKQELYEIKLEASFVICLPHVHLISGSELRISEIGFLIAAIWVQDGTNCVNLIGAWKRKWKKGFE